MGTGGREGCAARSLGTEFEVRPVISASHTPGSPRRAPPPRPYSPPWPPFSRNPGRVIRLFHPAPPAGACRGRIAGEWSSPGRTPRTRDPRSPTLTRVTWRRKRTRSLSPGLSRCWTSGTLPGGSGGGTVPSHSWVSREDAARRPRPPACTGRLSQRWDLPHQEHLDPPPVRLSSPPPPSPHARVLQAWC